MLNNELKILDVGSLDGQGDYNYSDIFNEKNWTYTGLDFQAGHNVDIVVTDIYNWFEVEDNTYDVVISGQIFVDGLGVGDVGNIVLRDRQNLAENGIIIVVMTLEKYSNQLLAGPDIVTRGFVYVRESENLIDEAKQVVDDAVMECLEKNITDWGKLKMVVKDSLSDFLWKKMKRSPMILPIIMEVLN